MMQHNNIYEQKDPLTKGVHARKYREQCVKMTGMLKYIWQETSLSTEVECNFGWVKILGELPRTYRSLNPIFCTQWEVSVNFG